MDLLNSFKGEKYESFVELSKHCQRYPEMCARLRRLLSEISKCQQSSNKKILNLCEAYLKEKENMSYCDEYMVNTMKKIVDFQLSVAENDTILDTLKRIELDYRKKLKKPPYTKLYVLDNVPQKLKTMSSNINTAGCNLATEKLLILLNKTGNEGKISRYNKQVTRLIEKYNKKVDEIDSEHSENLKILYDMTIAYIEEISKHIHTYGCSQINTYKNNISELETLLGVLTKEPLALLKDYYSNGMYDIPLERISKDTFMDRIDKASQKHYSNELEKLNKKKSSGSFKNSSNLDKNDSQKSGKSKSNSKSNDHDSQSGDSFSVSAIHTLGRERSLSKCDQISAQDDQQNDSINSNTQNYPRFDSFIGNDEPGNESTLALGDNKKSKRKDSFAFSDDDSDDPNSINNNSSSDTSIKQIKISFKSKKLEESNVLTSRNTFDNGDDCELKKIAGEIKLGFNEQPSKTAQFPGTSIGIATNITPLLNQSTTSTPTLKLTNNEYQTIKSKSNLDVNTITQSLNNITGVNKDDKNIPPAHNHTPNISTTQLNKSFTDFINITNKSVGGDDEKNACQNTPISISTSTLRKSSSMLDPNMLNKLIGQNNKPTPVINSTTPLSFAAIDTINLHMERDSEPQLSITGIFAISIDRKSFNNIKNLGKSNSIFFSLNLNNEYINNFNINNALVLEQNSDNPLLKIFTINDINLLKCTTDMMFQNNDRPYFIHNLLQYNVMTSTKMIPINTDSTMTLSPDMRRALITVKVIVNPTSLWLAAAANTTTTASSNTFVANKLSFISITMALDDLQQQSNLTLVTANHNLKYPPPTFVPDKNWLIWRIPEIPLLSSKESTIIELTTALGGSSPILVKHNINTKSINKLSVSFTCDDAQFSPISFSLLNTTDPMYSLNIFKKKINTGSYIFLQ